MKRSLWIAGLWMGSAAGALAQWPFTAPRLDAMPEPQVRDWSQLAPNHPDRLRMEGKVRLEHNGRWWSNPDTAQRLNLTPEQLRRMDDIFQQNRIQLIDLKAGLEKAEAILEPLLAADQPDDAKVVAQIDRVAQARADLEKVNARMLWGIRRVLTAEQWKNLQSGANQFPNFLRTK